MKRSASQQTSLVEAAKHYYQQFKGSPAEQYISDRGLGSVADQFKMGFVAPGSERIGHTDFSGRLVIPYLRPAGGDQAVVCLRFRCIQQVFDPEHSCKNHGGDKYRGELGAKTHLFNTQALVRGDSYVAVVEGELDAMAATAAGVPAIGVSGTGAWKDHYDRALVGYETVYVVADGDEPGREFARKVGERLDNAVMIKMPDGLDSNSFIHSFGEQAYKELLGL